jgi:hypothetical protein
MADKPLAKPETKLRFYTAKELIELYPPREHVPPLGREPTWAELVRLEPRLLALQRDIRAVDGSDPHFCANKVWYRPGGFKDRLCQLVGWYAERDDPVLRSSEAYDVAYDHLYRQLPPCRDCWCL